VLAASLACGVIGGAVLGVMLFDFSNAAQPTVVVPRSEGRLPAPPRALLTETRPEPSTNPVVPQLRTAPAPTVAAPSSGQGAADVGTPPVGAQGDTTVVVDIPIPDPPLPEKPEQDPEDPEPPKPEPPVLDDPSFKQPEPPKPEPDPDPPEFLPDLPLAPSAPLNPQPEPPSLPNFVPPAGFGS
jgi:hypothetical protein